MCAGAGAGAVWMDFMRTLDMYEATNSHVEWHKCTSNNMLHTHFMIQQNQMTCGCSFSGCRHRRRRRCCPDINSFIVSVLHHGAETKRENALTELSTTNPALREQTIHNINLFV